MTSVRLLTAAVLICTASAFAQEQSSSATHPNHTAEPEKPAQTAATEPWKLVLNRPTYSRESSLQWLQLDPMAVRADAQPGDDTLCYKIRSYVVARDSKDSESVHPVGYSTCQPASRYRLKKTQIQTVSSAR
jgi:hypothetical protein